MNERSKSLKMNIGEVGAALFVHSKRAKHLSVSIKPFQGIRVVVPSKINLESAFQMIKPKLGWIKKQATKIKKLEKEYVNISKSSLPCDERKAKKILLERLQKIASENLFTYNRAFIRNQRTRWGSCSLKNNISLNIKLILLPDELIDYVIFHELLHTKIKHHNKEFWKKLKNHIPDADYSKLRLKKFYLG